jgi:hypothetical protein
LALGKTVDELDRHLGAHEFAEWMAYYQVEPFGEDRADLRMAQIAALIFNAWFSGEKTIGDFMPFADPPSQSGSVQRAMAQYNNDTVRAKHGHH